MFYALGFIKIAIMSSFSLKDKRRVVKSILQRVKNEFNVSIAEVDYQDLQQTALLGYGFVGTDKLLVEKKVALLVDFIDTNYDVTIVEHHREIAVIGFSTQRSDFEAKKYVG
ncbi:MAG: DUF503 domain-containing protein [Deltaproteobacteria bacterium]|nr:DUF503 domain-containing protein [Deltaproteobacteria bacterium]